MGDFSSSISAAGKRRSSVGMPSAPPPKRTAQPSSQDPLAGTEELLPHVGRSLLAHSGSIVPRRLTLENGALLSIRLQNFKSHANFALAFGPRLNFIVGQNGTGKSSILAGIIAVLGGNPNKHSRSAGGSKASHGLIRDGRDSCMVELDIANGGADPFVPFDAPHAPSTLTVTLRLTRLGGTRVSSSYSINGRAVPVKRVRELADFFCYEVENPCVINTQAVSASFLKEPKDAPLRYSFFLRASNLEHLRVSYRQALDEKAQMEKHLERHGSALAALRADVDEHKRRMTAAIERVELERELSQAERRSAYAILASAKASVASSRGAAHAASEAAVSAEAAERAAKNAHRMARNATARRNAESQEVMATLERHTARAEELKREYKAAVRSVKEVESQLEDARDAQRDQRAGVDELRRSLEEQRRGLDAATARADTEVHARIERLAAFAAEAAAELDTARSDMKSSEAAAERASTTAASSRRAAADAKRDHCDAQKEAERLVKARDGPSDTDRRAALFHRDMPALLRSVQACPPGSWSAFAPVGPLGMHLSVRPELSDKYGDALEKALGGWTTLSSFVVGSHADEVRLRSMCSAGLRALKVLIMPAEARFKPSPPAARPPVDSTGQQAVPVLDALLPVTSDVAFNALLNMQMPECCLLLPTLADVEKLIFASGSKFLRAFTPDGTSHFKRGHTTASEPPIARRSTAWSSLLCGSQGDSAAMIAAQSQRQERAAAEASEAAMRLARAADADVRAARSAEAAAKSAAERVRGLERQAVKAEDDVDDAREQRAVSGPAAVLQSTHRELEGAQHAVREAEAVEARLQPQLEARRAAVEVTKAKLAEAQAEQQRLSSLAESDGGKENDAPTADGGGCGGWLDLQSVAHAAQRAEAAANKARQTLHSRRADLAKKVEEVREGERLVREQFPEGPPHDLAYPDDDAELEAREKLAREAEAEAKRALNALAAKLRHADKRCGGSAERPAHTTHALASALAAAERAVAEHDRDATNCVTTLAKLGPAIKERKRFWRESLLRKAAESSADFDRCLSLRGLAGSLQFDHKQERLDPTVYTNSQDRQAHSSRCLKTLSGGEQAFSTLSFTLAMWPFSTSPLRAMDEFDKNMDSIALQASLKLLLEAAEKAPSRQILILTPNDYHGALDGEVCKPVMERLHAQSGRAVEILKIKPIDRDQFE